MKGRGGGKVQEKGNRKRVAAGSKKKKEGRGGKEVAHEM